jgi:transposase
MPLEITIPLDIADVRLLETEITDAGEFVISVESTCEGATCHRCGAWITLFHGHDAPILLRHLPILNRTVFIRIRPRRYRCPSCRGGPTTTQRSSWYEQGRPHTKAYDQWLLLLLVNATISDVARKEGLGYKAVLGALRHQIGTETAWALVDELGTLGIDEISLRKGHKAFVTVISSRVGGQLTVLAVLESRKKKPVRRFLRSIPQRLLATITSVCTDMSGAFTAAVRSAVPGARHVVDRFHVTTHYHDAADAVRQRERRRLKRELPKGDYERDVAGVMWLYRAKAGSLDEEKQARLERFFEKAPAARHAWELSEQLTAIFEQRLTKEQAREALECWIEEADAHGYARFCRMVRTWMDEITNYFVARETSGFVEGLNNKLKVLKRRCYGIFNLDDFLRRIRVDVELPHVFGMV